MKAEERHINPIFFTNMLFITNKTEFHTDPNMHLPVRISEQNLLHKFYMQPSGQGFTSEAKYFSLGYK